MRIAFHALLKPPDHPVPSGDRAMARLLLRALGHHEVSLASRFRSFDRAGDAARQARLRDLGGGLARRFLRRQTAAPQLWFTYHCHHKAPDWLGPAIASALRIPYVLAEASLAAKRAHGAWAIGHEGAVAAARAADAILCLNAADKPGLLAHGIAPERLIDFAPFIDTQPFDAAVRERAAHRAYWARRFGLDEATPRLAVAAMMRPGDKLESYRVLGRALTALQDLPWTLLVAGDGPARAEVDRALAPVAHRVRPAGVLTPEAMPGFLAACDLCVWPAVGEAYGMALLEAQAAGCAVIAGAEGGVPGIVADGQTGVLTPPGDAAAFAAALRGLLTDSARRRAMGRAAMAHARERHSLDRATRALDRVLASVVGSPP